MSWLGSFGSNLLSLGQKAAGSLGSLGSLQSTVANGIHSASDIAGKIGQGISQAAPLLDSAGLGGAARYVGQGIQSGSALGHAVGNLVNSQSLDDAIGNGRTVMEKGIQFAGDLTGRSQPAISPLTK